jgi:hypothetical protein
MAKSSHKRIVAGWEASQWDKKDWLTFERVGLRPSMDLDDMKLRWVTKSVKKDLDFVGAVESCTLERTIEGASTVTIIVRDPRGRIFSEKAKRVRHSYRGKYKKQPEPVDIGWQPMRYVDLIGKAIELELDKVVFRLVKIHYVHSTEQITLTFEDRMVYWLKRKFGEKAASRASVTRAEFILSLLREVKEETIPFVCPALHQKQRIARAE